MRGQTGRVFTSATGLKKEIRQLLLHNGEDTVEIDVSCCQPLLLVLLATHVPKEELSRYQTLTESGLFYDTIANALSLQRNDVKAGFVKWLFGASISKTKKAAKPLVDIDGWFKDEISRS